MPSSVVMRGRDRARAAAPGPAHDPAGSAPPCSHCSCNRNKRTHPVRVRGGPPAGLPARPGRDSLPWILPRRRRTREARSLSRTQSGQPMVWRARGPARRGRRRRPRAGRLLPRPLRAAGVPSSRRRRGSSSATWSSPRRPASRSAGTGSATCDGPPCAASVPAGPHVPRPAPLLRLPLLIRHGESVKVVQRRLGHKTAHETLDAYGHLWPDSDDRTRDAVDAELLRSAVRRCGGSTRPSVGDDLALMQQVESAIGRRSAAAGAVGSCRSCGSRGRLASPSSRAG